MKVTTLQSLIGFLSFFVMAFIFYDFVDKLLRPKLFIFKKAYLENPLFTYRVQKLIFCLFFATFFMLYNMVLQNINIKFLLFNIVWILSMFLFEGKFKFKLTIFLLYTQISYNVESTIVPLVLYYTSYNGSNVHLSFYLTLLYISINYILNFLILKYVGAKISPIKEIFEYKEVNIIIYILISMLIATYGNSFLLIGGTDAKANLLYSVISFSIIASILFILNIISILLNYINSLHNYNFTVQTLNTYDKFISLNEEYIENVNKIRHDINNHILICKNLLAHNDISTLKTYLGNLEETTFQENPVFVTGNTLLNIILSQKLSLALSKNVKFETTCELFEQVQISDSHFASLLFNLLDNAINAASMSELKYVNCFITTTDNNLVIIIKNSVMDIEKTINDLTTIRLSKKSFIRKHGYGLYIIQDIISIHNGIQKITSTEEGVKIFIAINNIKK